MGDGHRFPLRCPVGYRRRSIGHAGRRSDMAKWTSSLKKPWRVRGWGLVFLAGRHHAFFEEDYAQLCALLS